MAAKRISLRVSGQAESFLQYMKGKGYDEIEVISLALGLLQEAVNTGRVAKVTKNESQLSSEQSALAIQATSEIEYYYSLPKKLSSNEFSSS